MNARWPLLFALVGFALCASPLGAQSRTTITGRGSRPVAPHPGPSAPHAPVRPPFQTTAIAPSLGGPRGHHPIPFRSALFGLILVDPYWWSAPDVGDESFVAAPVTPPFVLEPAPLPTGGVQLDVEPRGALVFVDGALAGTVDRFSGYYQHLEAAAGPHVIDLVAPQYEPLTISVTVVPGRTLTYRASLNRSDRH